MHHTPSKLSVRLYATGVADGFERDTEYILGNRTRREKVISDSRNSTFVVRRQSTTHRRCEWGLDQREIAYPLVRMVGPRLY